MENSNIATVVQDKPKGVGTPIVDLVIQDMLARKEFGVQKYGEPLKIFNGRNALIDAYQESLDLCIYLRQLVEEQQVTNV